jgi:hypothetical protein
MNTVHKRNIKKTVYDNGQHVTFESVRLRHESDETDPVSLRIEIKEKDLAVKLINIFSSF